MARAPLELLDVPVADGKAAVSSCSFHSSGSHFMTCSEDDVLRLMDADTLRVTSATEFNDIGCSSAVFAPTGGPDLAMVAPRHDTDLQAYLVSLDCGDVIAAYDLTHSDIALSLTPRKSGEMTDAAGPRKGPLLQSWTAPISSLSLHPTNGTFATCIADSHVSWVHPAVARPVAETAAGTLRGRGHVSFAADGTQCLIADEESFRVLDWRMLEAGPHTTMQMGSIMGSQTLSSSLLTSSQANVAWASGAAGVEPHPTESSVALLTSNTGRVVAVNWQDTSVAHDFGKGHSADYINSRLRELAQLRFQGKPASGIASALSAPENGSSAAKEDDMDNVRWAVAPARYSPSGECILQGCTTGIPHGKQVRPLLIYRSHTSQRGEAKLDWALRVRHRAPITAVAFSPTAAMAVTCCHDVQVWSAAGLA